MEKFNIEAYIDGELSGEALEAFEAEMQRNVAFAEEVRELQQLTEDIDIQMLRNTVSEALSRPSKPKRSAPWWRWLLGALGVALALGLIYWQFADRAARPTDTETIETPSIETPVMPSSEPTENEESQAPEEVPIQEETPERKKSRPIAEIQPSEAIPDPLYTAPNVRGAQQENAARKALLDQLWYTEYPPASMQFGAPFEKIDTLLKGRNFTQAYVRLQALERKMAANDTLHFLKGYCLLELGQGAEALPYWQGLEGRQPNLKNHLEWYRALAALISGQRSEATEQFEAIAADAKQPFQKQAKKAVKLIE